MLYFFKMFETMVKKNKAFMSIAFYILSIYFAITFVTSAYDIKTYGPRITNHDKSITSLQEITTGIVTRPSFNAYIKRKDEELLRQIEFNQSIAQQVGFLSGQLYMVEEVFKSVSGKEITQEINE